MRRLLSLEWCGKHLLAVLLVIATIGLGRWQLGRGLSATGGLQNLGYAAQWWFFTGVVVFGWFRLARDEVTGRERGPSRAEQMRARVAAAEASGQGWVELDERPTHPARPAPPATTATTATDGEDLDLAAYNAYLARLNGRR